MSYDAMLQKALKFHQQGKFDEAEPLYRQILQTAPNQPMVLNLLGLIAQSKGLHEEASNYFEKAIINDFNNFELYFNLAWSLEALGKYVEAEDAYNKALKIKPNIKEVYNALGGIYALTGKKEQAAEMFRKALDFEPAYVEAEINLAYLNRDIKELKRLLEENPSESSPAYYLALLYRDDGDLQTALSYAIKAADGTPIEGYQLLAGELYTALACPEAASVYFCEALQLNPRSIPALVNLANIESDAEAAEKMYKQAIGINDQDFDAHLNYAVLLHRLNRLPEALEEYRKAVIINPDAAEVSANLGTLHRGLEELERAVDLFFNAFNLAPDNPQYALNIAETLVMLHRENPQQAEKIAADWYKKCPQNIFASRVNAAFKGKDIGNDTQYSRELFDLFADTYENTMQNLEYGLPGKMAEFAGKVQGTIIDLGCGTGLLGQKLKNDDNRIIGVDISSKMLQKAKEKDVYAELIEADIIEYCRCLPEDATVFAADVIGYIGDIAPLVEPIFPRDFIFSAAIDDTMPADFKLSESGRYIYKGEYIAKTLTAAGYQNIKNLPTVLRRENGQDVEGMIFYAKEKADEP